MLRLVIESWVLLLHFDLVMRFRSFGALYGTVREQKIEASESASETTEGVCHAVDLACVLYFKQVQCLQRSAATTVLLRRYGRNAELVVGAQLLPFMSHAWVEIDGQVVNDKPYMPEIFSVLTRC